MRRYRVSFEPFTPVTAMFLMERTGIDFSKVDFTGDEWFCATVFRELSPVIAMAFEFKSPHDAQATVAVFDQRGLSRRLLTAVFRAVFSRAARITLLVQPGNTTVHQQVWRMGFRNEGYFRAGYDGKEDAVVYGLLPEDCPYMRGEAFVFQRVRPTHEQPMGVQ